MNKRRRGEKYAIRHTGLKLYSNAYIWHARSVTLLRSMGWHTLGGDHDDGTHMVPYVLG